MGLSSRTFTAYTALLGLVQSAVPTTVVVYDGPQPASPTDREFFVLGCNDPRVDDFTLAIEGGSDWAALGAGQREENFAIHNSYVVWAGDTSLAALREQAATSIGLVEAALRSNVDLLQNLGRGGWSGLSITQMLPSQTAKGATLIVLFDVICKARI